MVISTGFTCKMEHDSSEKALLPVPHFLHLETVYNIFPLVQRKDIFIHKLFLLTLKSYDIGRQIPLKCDGVGEILLV